MPEYNTEDPRVTIWRDRIARSKKARKKMLKDRQIYINFYEGNQWTAKKTTLSEKPVINLIFAYIKTQLPFLYFQNPKWYCSPRGAAQYMTQLQANAELATRFVNYYAKENLGIALKKQMRLAILDAFFAFGTIKVGYSAAFETNTNFGNNKVLGEDENGDPIYEVDSETGEILKDEEEKILVNEAFFARRRSPNAMLFDPECENFFEDGKWIAEEIVKPTQDIKNSELYENTKDLKPSGAIKPGFDIQDSDLEEMKELQGDLERNTIYEIYDLEHDRLIVLADGHDKFLRDEPIPEGIDKHPYAFLRFNETPDKMYPISDIALLKSLQEEINVGRGMIMTHAKRFNRKYGYTDETFAGTDGAVEMEKLKNSEDGTLFKYTGTMPEPLKDAPLDAAVYQNFSQSFIDFREVSGSTEMDRGLVERRKTATEAGQIAKASNIRKEDRKSLVEDFAAEVGNKLVQSMQANLTREMAVQIIGPEGQMWQNVTREEIEGEFTTSVEIGSMAPRLPEFERQELVQMLQVIAQFPPEVVMVKINFDGLIENLRKYFPLLDTTKIINSPSKQRELQQLLIQMKQQKQQRIE